MGSSFVSLGQMATNSFVTFPNLAPYAATVELFFYRLGLALPAQGPPDSICKVQTVSRRKGGVSMHPPGKTVPETFKNDFYSKKLVAEIACWIFFFCTWCHYLLS